MNKPFPLPPALETFVEELVANGRYATAGEAVVEGLHLLKESEERRSARLAELRRAWQEGVESGNYRPAEEVFDRLIAKYDAMAKAAER